MKLIAAENCPLPSKAQIAFETTITLAFGPSAVLRNTQFVSSPARKKSHTFKHISKILQHAVTVQKIVLLFKIKPR